MAHDGLLETLANRTLLCDGGMGTQLLAAGLTTGESGVLWNVDQPQVIEAVHRRYLDAGCELITTNTFTASRTALTMYSLADRTVELNEAAARIARHAAGDGAWVLADIGPFGGFLEPLGETTRAELHDVFTEQLIALREGGADAVIIETMSDPAELSIAVNAAKALGDWPVIATCAFQRAAERYVTMMGTSPSHVVKAAFDAGADIVGANCGTDLNLDDYARLAEQLLAAADGRPVILQPNAGAPKQVDGVLQYPAEPRDMMELVRALLNQGVRIIGGCCGTTPDHLRMMAQARDRFGS